MSVHQPGHRRGHGDRQRQHHRPTDGQRRGQPEQLPERRHLGPHPVQRCGVRAERHLVHTAERPGFSHLVHGHRIQPVRRLHQQHGHQPDLQPHSGPQHPARPDGHRHLGHQPDPHRRHRLVQPDDQHGRHPTSVIPGCSSQSNWSTPVASGSNYTAYATCSVTEPSNGTGAFSASYSGGTYTASSQANLGQTNTLTPSLSCGANSQTNAGGCTSCYYGESVPDAEGDAFVNGNLSGQLTIGTQNNVIIDGNLTYADCSGHWITGQSGRPPELLPLLQRQHQRLARPDRQPVRGGQPPGDQRQRQRAAFVRHRLRRPVRPVELGGGITIDAAILALTQSFVVNNYGVANSATPNGDEGPLNVYGSIQQYARGPVGTFSGNQSVSGYVKHYTWNPLLDFASPPSYLTPSTAPWVLSSVNANGGERTTTICPTLPGIYSTTGPTTPITQYCSGRPAACPAIRPSPCLRRRPMPRPPPSIGGTATVTWTDPSGNGSPITNYGIIANPACPTCVITGTGSGSSTSATITGLNPGTSLRLHGDRHQQLRHQRPVQPHLVGGRSDRALRPDPGERRGQRQRHGVRQLDRSVVSRARPSPSTR